MREKLIELLNEALNRKDGIAKVVGESFVNKIADHLIANGVTIQKWIPVTERLPEKEGTYIVTTTTGAVTTARFYTAATFPPTHYREYEWHRKASWSHNRHVTHWMPPAEPPKEV